ncbi:MAG: N-acetylmuramoyl-L-alanine amidase [Candidatus Sericytochromatia bacterium]|nr:N-acetylmuramoyl-L-alanine amidase [Candidatus Sericytochromatia bacterium]
MTSCWIHRSIAASLGLLVLTAATPPESPLTAIGPGLNGRTIVIDPGHGGPKDSGAVSRAGLKESHVNLMVGLRLAEILRQQGANVLLTRTADVTVGTEADGGDLAARAAIANDAKADLFVSIHHNDTLAQGDPRNDTQIYWKIDDPGPSRDFAQLLLPRLATSLGMARQQLIAGNFAVLRHNRRPAILGEGAYLSNPVSAVQLTKAETWQREAAAYGSAIEAYFARGVPQFDDLQWEDGNTEGRPIRQADASGRPPMISDWLSLKLVPDGGTIGSATLSVDGEPVTSRYDPAGSRLTWTPEWPLRNGAHALRADARNAAGNAAIPFVGRLMIDRPSARIQALAVPMAWQPDAADAAIFRASIRDALGLPVADGTPVTIRWGDQSVTKQSVGGAIATTLPWPNRGPVNAEIQAGTVTYRVVFAEGPRRSYLNLVVNGLGANVAAATVTLDDQGLTAPDNPDPTTFATYEINPGAHRLSVQALGYEPWNGTITTPVGRVTNAPITLTPRFAGVLQGKRIMLDPFTPPSGTASAAQTLALANALRDRLVEGGATVVLARTDAGPVSPEDRCRAMGRTACDLYVGLDLGRGQVVHYYTSAGGSRLARFIGKELQGYSPAPEASYMVTHSPCVAVVVRARSTSEQEADALFEAVRQYYGPS